MYNSFADVEKICRERGWTPAHLFLENEKKLTGRSEEEILRALDERLRVMEDAAARALNGPLHAVGGLIDGVAEKQWRYAAGETLCGGFLNRVMARAYSCSEVNASMGRICAAPTAGSCGILPAVLLTMQEALRDFPVIKIAEGSTKLLYNGGKIQEKYFTKQPKALQEDEIAAVYDFENHLVGLYILKKAETNFYIKPFKMLV